LLLTLQILKLPGQHLRKFQKFLLKVKVVLEIQVVKELLDLEEMLV
jgi:hypothetical protein